MSIPVYVTFFFFQAEDGIRDTSVTGVQTCALPISEQIAGLYDPKSGEFFIADWINPAEQRVVMAHELTHALQDQHFKVDRSEERRVGKECRCRWTRDHEKEKQGRENSRERKTIDEQ